MAQLKKQNWKKIRDKIPCMSCGENHPTKTCVRRDGVKHKVNRINRY